MTEETCREIAKRVRDLLIESDVGIPKDVIRYGIFENAHGDTHVVVVIDITGQLFKGGFRLKGTR